MQIKNLDFTIDFKMLDVMIHARKMFGKMQELLKDARAVRFEISVRLYWAGSEEPDAISMEGARSASGAWNMQFPRDLESKVLESPEALREGLLCVEKAVRSYIVENALDEDWSEMEAALRDAKKSGVSADTLEYRTEIPVLAIVPYGYDAHLYAPLMATAYVIEGMEALAENNLERASYCVELGSDWSSPKMLVPEPNDRFSARARTGGHGKADNSEPVKIKVVELLKKLEPEGGWISDREAVDRVANELAKEPLYLQLVENCGLEYDNLPRTIAGWVKGKPERFQCRIKPGGMQP